MTLPNHDRFLFALVWLLLVWMAIATCSVAKAEDAARVYLAPAEPVLAIGEATTLTIRVAGATDLYGVELHLQYDPAVLQVLDADGSQAGVQITPGDFLDPNLGFTVANRADNQVGALDYAITLLAPAEAVSGDGILASLEVGALADGSGELALSAILASAEGVSLPVVVESGRLTVGSGSGNTPTPTPPAATTAGPGERAPTATATPTNGPTATKAPTATPVTGHPAPTAGQSTTTAGQSATATGAPTTLETQPTDQPGLDDQNEGAQALAAETVDAVGEQATIPTGSEVEPQGVDTTVANPMPGAVPSAPSTSELAADSGQDNDSILTGGLVLAVFFLIALAIFFGRRLLSRKL